MSDHQVTVAPEAFPAEIMERMQRGLHDARGTMAPETERAMRRAFAAFRQWCAGQEMSDLPAASESVAAYADDLAAITGRKAAGIKQSIWAIGAVHRLAKFPDPTKAEIVRQALKRLSKQLGTRQQQAAPIGAYEIRRITETAGKRPADLRNQAILLMMRDLLARRSETVALDVVDIHYDRDGSGTALIRRGKTDQTGEGVELYLSAPAVTALRRWLAAARITEGAIFRSVNKAGVPGERLQGAEVARIIKHMAGGAGLPSDTIKRMSGHSCRVGMAQDLVASGADMAGVMQAGRWKSPQMPARYSERLGAKRGAVARLYERPIG